MLGAEQEHQDHQTDHGDPTGHTRKLVKLACERDIAQTRYILTHD